MRYVLPIVLAACGGKPPVVTWSTSGTAMNERIEVHSGGDVQYTTTVNGVVDKSERLSLSSDQVAELDDIFRSQGACQLVHEPGYTPQPDEGQTTLVIAFPNQRCTVVLWNREWERGPAQPISETMRSMRPLRGARPTGRIPQP
jgi:hypothetical protein